MSDPGWKYIMFLLVVYVHAGVLSILPVFNPDHSPLK